MRGFDPALLLLIQVLATSATAQRPNHDCSESGHVGYSAPNRELLSHVTAEVLSHDDTVARDLAVQGSPTHSLQGTRWLALSIPDFTKPGPWHTNVDIGRADQRSPFLRLRFRDHGNGGVQAMWLNEKLLFIRAWWGRVVSTDSIFDVQANQWLYREDADYLTLTVPCSPNTTK